MFSDNSDIKKAQEIVPFYLRLYLSATDN